MSKDPSDAMISFVRQVVLDVMAGDDEIHPLALVKTARYVHNWIATDPSEAYDQHDTIFTVYGAYLFDLNG